MVNDTVLPEDLTGMSYNWIGSVQHTMEVLHAPIQLVPWLSLFSAYLSYVCNIAW